MLAFRGTLNSGIVKALGINNSFPLLSNVSASSIVLKRNQSGVEQNGIMCYPLCVFDGIC